MKKLALLFVMFSGLTIAQISSNSIKLGDYKEGGIVFYLDESGEHGLVCSLSDQSNATTWSKQKAVRKNERMSENFHTSKTIFGNKYERREARNVKNALKLCKKLKVEINGEKFKDYYLPSKEHLLILYKNLDLVNKALESNDGQKIKSAIYWSSIEYDYTNAMVLNFKDGKEGHYYKNYLYNVRAIRAF